MSGEINGDLAKITIILVRKVDYINSRADI